MNGYRIYLNQQKERSFLSALSLTTKLIILNVFCFLLFSVLILFNVIPGEFVYLSRAGIFDKHYFWTFLTSMFMHGGIFHLFVNMFSLFFVGSLIEKIMGQKRFFWFYIFAGFFAGLLHIIFEQAFGVGASGALFGLIGVLIFLTPNLPVYMMFIPIPIKMKYAAPGMLVVLWIVSAIGNIPIGNIAHLGGLLFGVFYGLYLRYKFPNKIKYIQKRFS